MEEDLIFFENRRRPQFFDNGRRPQFFEDRRQPIFFENKRQPQKQINSTNSTVQHRSPCQHNNQQYIGTKGHKTIRMCC